MATLFIALFFGWIAMGTRHAYSKRKQMVVDYQFSYWTFFWSSLYGIVTIPSIGFLYYFKHYKTITLKISLLPIL
jgi:hypothetical protein